MKLGHVLAYQSTELIVSEVFKVLNHDLLHQLGFKD